MVSADLDAPMTAMERGLRMESSSPPCGGALVTSAAGPGVLRVTVKGVLVQCGLREDGFGGADAPEGRATAVAGEGRSEGSTAPTVVGQPGCHASAFP